MTSRAVSYIQIECDSCGTRHESTDLDATTARINANRDGWKYTAFSIAGLGLQKYGRGAEKSETVPRQWDCCPDCPLPGSAVEAAEIRGRRKVNVRGKWIDREPAVVEQAARVVLDRPRNPG